MITEGEKIADSYMFHSREQSSEKMRIMQDITDCLLSNREKECKHCKKVVTCGFTWQALFSLNSYM